MSSEMLHLEWDNFRDNLVNSIANFKEKHFADVILACEDRQVKLIAELLLQHRLWFTGDDTQIGSGCLLPGSTGYAGQVSPPSTTDLPQRGQVCRYQGSPRLHLQRAGGTGTGKA